MKNYKPAWNRGIFKTTSQEVRELVLLDPEDKGLFDTYFWKIDSVTGYVRAQESVTRTYIRLHRLLLNAPEDLMVDHINGDKFDNRRSNLRLATRTQNSQNRKVNENNKSGYKGVIWNKAHQKWHAYIRIEKKLKHLGYFSDILEAARAYNEAANQHFGSYGRLNEITK